MFGVDILDLCHGIQINLLNQTIKSNSVGSGYMSHCWTSDFDDHFNHGFVILKDEQHRTKSKKLAFYGTQSTLLRSKLLCWVGTLVLFWVYVFDVVSRDRFPVLDLWVLLSWFGRK